MRGATTLGEYKGRATATSVVGLCLGSEALSRRLVERVARVLVVGAKRRPRAFRRRNECLRLFEVTHAVWVLNVVRKRIDG